jgi:hypothetical protein
VEIHRTAHGRRDHRPGSFKLGHKKLGGRKKGTPNAISADLKKALLQAADRVGSDGNGKDGLGGYFAWLRTREPDFVYVFLLGRMLDFEEYLKTVPGNPPPATNEPDEGVQCSIDGTKSAGRTKELKSLGWPARRRRCTGRSCPGHYANGHRATENIRTNVCCRLADAAEELAPPCSLWSCELTFLRTTLWHQLMDVRSYAL